MYLDAIRAADAHTSRQGRHADAVAVARAALQAEFSDALLTDPTRIVATPGYRDAERRDFKPMTAADVMADDMGGGDPLFIELLRLLGSAARGEAVRVRAQLIVSIAAARHAEFHADDAAEADTEGADERCERNRFDDAMHSREAA